MSLHYFDVSLFLLFALPYVLISRLRNTSTPHQSLVTIARRCSLRTASRALLVISHLMLYKHEIDIDIEVVAGRAVDQVHTAGPGARSYISTRFGTCIINRYLFFLPSCNAVNVESLLQCCRCKSTFNSAKDSMNSTNSTCRTTLCDRHCNSEHRGGYLRRRGTFMQDITCSINGLGLQTLILFV